MNWRQNRFIGFTYIFFVYAVACGLGIWAFHFQVSASILIRIFWADILATVFVYLAGAAVRNSSVYDPYWSVAPMAILILLTSHWGIQHPGSYLLILVICFWGVRLTANWAYTFSCLDRQDWRYDLLKERSPRMYPLVNLAGIHLFPTLVVFCALLPAIYYIRHSTLNIATYSGLALCVAATILQMTADLQMQRFRRDNDDRSRIANIGLWKYARHPNYLGEIILWWGVYIVMLSSLPEYWYLGAGALLNTLMFLFISIPMAEKRLRAYKRDFDTYRRKGSLSLSVKRGYNLITRAGDQDGANL